jgi:hypothetical protein
MLSHHLLLNVMETAFSIPRLLLPGRLNFSSYWVVF